MSSRRIWLPTWLVRLILVGLAVVLTVCLLAACGSDGGANATSVPELIDTLPTNWTPIMFDAGRWFREGNPWLPISIDGDGETEYLLFFTYDSGQAGAVIYDQQIGTVGAAGPTPAPAPNQPAGTYVPYRIEPNYWTGAGAVGYVAPPGVTPADLVYAQVERLDPNDPGATPTGTNDELYVIGSNKVLTVVWWQSEYNGYGVAQVGATFGLANPVHEQNDPARPIAVILGLNPVGGTLARSLICRETRFDRGLAPEAPGVVDPYQPAVQYTGTDRGLGFCYMPPPSYPFYPEGVVLAYLKPVNRSNPDQTMDEVTAYRNQFLAPDVTPDQQQAFLSIVYFDDSAANMSLPVVVQDLVAPAVVPAAPELRTAGNAAVTTRVCAQVASADLASNRRLLFQLVHEPPTIQSADGTMTTTTDLWRIADVSDASAAGTTCSAVILQLGTQSQ
jgi:hypothetical protein